MKKEKTKSKLPKIPKELKEKAAKATGKLEAYLKKHKLDPTKDWSKDKVHGKKVKELLTSVNVVRDQIKEKAPVEIHHKKSEDKKAKATSKEKSKKEPSQGRATKYDYPLVDGKPMSNIEKKKYRAEMRRIAAGNGTESKPPKEKAPAKAKSKKEPTKKAVATTKTSEAKVKKVKKSSKKTKREED